MSDNGETRERDRVRDSDNDPPNSRLFIVCSKATTEEDLEPELRQYGNLQYRSFALSSKYVIRIFCHAL